MARRATGTNAAHGTPRDTPLAAAERARIRTDVGREMFAEQHGRDPKDPRELSVVPRPELPAGDHRGGRVRPDVLPGQVGVHAVGGRPRRRSPSRSRRRTTPRSPTPCGGWSGRRGTPGAARGGVQQVDTPGLVAAAFTHRDSRAGDPDLHTHVAVSPRSRSADPDGTGGGSPWTRGCCTGQRRRLRALQHPPRGRAAPAARGDVRARSDADAAAAAGKRTVREIVGVDPRTDARRGPRGGRASTSAGPRWRPRSRPTTAGRRPRWRRSSWPSRPPWRPGTPSTSPAPRPSSAATWRAEAAHLLGCPRPGRPARRHGASPLPPRSAAHTSRSGTHPAQRRRPARPRTTDPCASSRPGPRGRSGTSAPRPNGRSATGSAGVRTDLTSTSWSTRSSPTS